MNTYIQAKMNYMEASSSDEMTKTTRISDKVQEWADSFSKISDKWDRKEWVDEKWGSNMEDWDEEDQG